MNAFDEPEQNLPLEIGGKIQEDFLLGNLLTFLLAAYETTANSLAWALWELARRPNLQDRISLEGQKLPSDSDKIDASWVNETSWINGLTRESLRMYPSGWVQVRRTFSDYRIRDYLLPAGTGVYVSQWVTHRDPRWFPDPEKFLPERWLTESESPEQEGTSQKQKELPQFAFFPFGGGKRYCLGKAAFELEGSALIGELLANWELIPHEVCQPSPRF